MFTLVAGVAETHWIQSYYLSIVYSLGGRIEFRISSVWALVKVWGKSFPFFLSLPLFPDVETRTALAYFTRELGAYIAGFVGTCDIIIVTYFNIKIINNWIYIITISSNYLPSY